MKMSLMTPINVLGYGNVGVNILNELVNLDVEVSLFPIGKIACHPRYSDNVKKALENSKRFDKNAPCVKIWHQHDLATFVGKGMHVGFPIFELDNFRDMEKHHLKSCDRLFVCSQWAKDIIRKRIGEDIPVHVIPLGVNSEVFQPKVSRRKPTIFLNVGKWEKRKGHDILHTIFKSAFSNSTYLRKDVELWMMCDNPFIDEKTKKHWEAPYSRHNIRILPRVESDTQVAEIMQQADCGIFLSRGEGWNLENMEMMSCGKHIIATDYSGHTEFCTQENSMLVPINGLEPAVDNTWFFGEGNWGKLDGSSIETAINHMVKIHNLKQGGQLGLNTKGIETAQNFNWRKSALQIIDSLH